MITCCSIRTWLYCPQSAPWVRQETNHTTSCKWNWIINKWGITLGSWWRPKPSNGERRNWQDKLTCYQTLGVLMAVLTNQCATFYLQQLVFMMKVVHRNKTLFLFPPIIWQCSTLSFRGSVKISGTFSMTRVASHISKSKMSQMLVCDSLQRWVGYKEDSGWRNVGSNNTLILRFCKTKLDYFSVWHLILKEKKTALGKQARAGVEPSTTFVINSTPLTTNLPGASVGPSAPPPNPPRLQSSKKKVCPYSAISISHLLEIS